MPVSREFLGWDRPALAAAAEYVRQRFASAGQLDLAKVVIVVPGGRARRRLLEILVGLCESHGLLLTPPTIVTPDQFPELLYEAQLLFADELTQQLAWVAAMRATPSKLLSSFLPSPPQAADLPQWLAVAESLRRLHVELAADALNCGDVLRGAADVEGFAEHQRWKTICELQERYLKTLDQLELWDVQTARLIAIKNREIRSESQILLLGTVDLNRAQRQMLDQIDGKVTALIVATPELADRFDEHGCLIPSQWIEATLPLKDEQVERVDGPADQASAVARWLASLDGKYRADQIAIGLPDGKLAPQIERQLAQSGVRGRWAVGRQLSETGPYRLLEVASDYAARRRFRELAALVRHPDVFDAMPASIRDRDPLTLLDQFAKERFPASLETERKNSPAENKPLHEVFDAIDKLLAPLAGKQRKLSEWAAALTQLLVAIYGNRDLDKNVESDRRLLGSLELIRGALDTVGRLPADLQTLVDAAQAAHIVLSTIAGEPISPPADADAIELLGWLDLPLDDAPATIVTTFNEGFVPSAATGDVFIPNRLREALGLVHNDRRLARDAYALALLLATRERLKLIVAHRDADGNPLVPSRLLFLTDSESLVRRARHYFDDLPPSPPRPNLLARKGTVRPRSALSPPRPKPLPEPIAELSVTKFRDYIACPYRFYLRHVAKLEGLTDDAMELDGAGFGNLIHLVLEQFGRTAEARPIRSETNPTRIADYLADTLDNIAAHNFGTKHVRPAVRVQVEQARLRLRAFAQWQAERAREGWRIVYSEDSSNREKLKAPFPVDGEPFTLLGRIDRIDFHEERQRLCVVDYKTADRGEEPARTHRRSEEWLDLQLPLYRHLVRAAKLAVPVPADAAIDLGYVVLPLDPSAVGLLLANWDQDSLKSADEKAHEIIRALRGQHFPQTTPPPPFFDDVAVICQDRRIGSWQAEDDAA